MHEELLLTDWINTSFKNEISMYKVTIKIMGLIKVHLITPEDISNTLSVLKLCKNKFDCLLTEMFVIKDLNS